MASCNSNPFDLSARLGDILPLQLAMTTGAVPILWVDLRRMNPMHIDPYNPRWTLHDNIVRHCEVCGKEIRRDHRMSDRRWKLRKFCSLKCSAVKNPPPLFKAKPMEKRFWDKVDQRSPDECWPWLGCRDGNGYGLFRIDKHTMLRSHIVMADLIQIPGDGPLVLHHCDNPPCCNPSHLYRGTAADNAKDRDTRNRWVDHWKKE